MTSRKVRLQFLAFERSLRVVGCDLPLLAIPYGNDRFELPSNSEWWDNERFVSWLPIFTCLRTTWNLLWQLITRENEPSFL
jgi:hypothetical protein